MHNPLDLPHLDRPGLDIDVDPQGPALTGLDLPGLARSGLDLPDPDLPETVFGKGHSAVRAMKRKRLSDGEPWQTFELFPAPPWATRSLCEHVLPVIGAPPLRDAAIAEPAAGLGHMSEVLAEYAPRVFASDIYPYPVAPPCTPLPIVIADFLADDWACRFPGDGIDANGAAARGPGESVPVATACDWIITNPPFGTSHLFLKRTLAHARMGVALLLRMQWLETSGRYERVYRPHPPSLIAPFSERVAMCEGGWDPRATTATMYAWFVWLRDAAGAWPEPLSGTGTLATYLIPPGRKAVHTKASDTALAQRCVPGFVPPSQKKKRPASPATGRSDAAR